MSGFTLDEKNKLYEILINYGVPVNVIDEQKDDWELLRILLNKEVKGEDSEVGLTAENIKNLERFVN
jgi:hypothetical protein